MWRRRQAAQRMEPLDCSGRCRDPLLSCRCEPPPPPLSERMVGAYRDTVLHLSHHGLLAAPDIPAMQVLWRRSAADRQLVAEVAQRWELAA